MNHLLITICFVILLAVVILIAFIKIMGYEYDNLHKIDTNENLTHGRFASIKEHIKKSSLSYCNSKESIDIATFDNEVELLFNNLASKTVDEIKQMFEKADKVYKKTFEYSILYAIMEIQTSKLIETVQYNKYVYPTYNKIKSKYSYNHPFDLYKTILTYVKTLYLIELDIIMLTVYTEGDVKYDDIQDMYDDILTEIKELINRIHNNILSITKIELKEILESGIEIPDFKIYSKSSLELLKSIDNYE